MRRVATSVVLVMLVAAAPLQLENPLKVRFHMNRQVDDLREIQRLLVLGKLDEARTRAHFLTMPETDPGLARWAGESAQLVEAGNKLADSTSLAESCRNQARVAVACANCHVRTRQTALFSPPPAVPGDDGTQASRVAQHLWAADRLREGMIEGTQDAWREGLSVLATSTLPASPAPDSALLADRVRELAQQGLASAQYATESLDSRAEAYGQMLVTCAACHPSK
jgi:cytochrome c553